MRTAERTGMRRGERGRFPRIISPGPPPTPDPNDLLLTILPNWDQENEKYIAEGFSVNAPFREHIEQSYNSTQLAIFGNGLANLSGDYQHDATESGDMWTAHHMVERLRGIWPVDTWESRRDSMKDFFITGYQAALTDGGREQQNNYDHIYGWGFCDWYRKYGAQEPDGGVTAKAAIDSLITLLVNWNSTWSENTPGDPIFTSSRNSTRRWARMLRLAVAAYEASPEPANLAWRDKVIDMVLQAPEWDQQYGMYFYGDTATNLAGYNYSAGERIAPTFHFGILMDALWQVYRVMTAEGDPRAGTAADRLIQMGQHYVDYGPDPDTPENLVPQYTGLNVNTGNRLPTGTLGSYGTPTGVYTIPPINGLCFAHKLSGNSTFYNLAVDLWQRWQREEHGTANQIGHYADTKLAPGNDLLAYNKGELQYAYALWDNGSNPPGLVGRPYDGQILSATDIANIPPGCWAEVQNSFMLTAEKLPQEYPDWDGNSSAQYDLVNCSTCGGQGIMAVIRNWGGGCWDSRRERLLISGGGHKAYCGNEVYAFDLPTLTWERVTDPTVVWTQCRDVNASDNTPASRHTYHCMEYISATDEMFLHGGGILGELCNNDPPVPPEGPCGGTCTLRNTWTLDIGGSPPTWTANSDENYSGVSCKYTTSYDEQLNRIYFGGRANSSSPPHFMKYWDVGTRTWSPNLDPTGQNRGVYTVSVFDPVNRLLVETCNGELTIWDVDNSFAKSTPASTGPKNIEDNGQACGLAFDTKNGKILGWHTGTSVFEFNPLSAVWTEHTAAPENLVTPPAVTAKGGIYGRWRYSKRYNVHVYVNAYDENVFLYRFA